ncbi:hypothetical protein WJX81_006467 [Elliptochloris bilobata]|uniref:NADP-dependent oxidoreductase domain-containing protein n=1 Tax=Elliptochloris bilobata TaxID=381761 RepID=A0AAW1QL68_9CHLO
MSAEAQALPLVPKQELAPGLRVSRVIKGCWQLSGGHKGQRASDRTAGKAAVEDFQPFVEAGITTFDTADIYGPSESLIGDYLERKGRGEPAVQVLTKFCCFGGDMRSVSAKSVRQAVDDSRQRLGVDSIDLIQFYWHDYGVRNYVAAAQHLAAAQEEGLCRHIGVTNFDVPRLKEMLDAGVRIVSNQVQYSLLDRRPENHMVDFCAERGIALLPYGTTAGGLLSERYLGLPASRVQVDTYSLSKYASVVREVSDWDWLQRLLQALEAVARRRGASIADVAQRWVLDRPQVAAIIVGARNANHVADHRRLFSLQLTDEDRAGIDAVLVGRRTVKGDCYTWERGGEW